MICLRCGYCCHNYVVVIVDNPELGIQESNLTTQGMVRKPCKHLRGDKPGEYSCAIHDYPWYPETPCFDFGQIEVGNTECRIGQYMLNQENAKNALSKKS